MTGFWGSYFNDPQCSKLLVVARREREQHIQRELLASTDALFNVTNSAYSDRLRRHDYVGKTKSHRYRCNAGSRCATVSIQRTFASGQLRYHTSRRFDNILR